VTDSELHAIAKKVLRRIELLEYEFLLLTTVSSVCMQTGMAMGSFTLLPFIGSQIKFIRKKKKMNQLALAHAVHVSASQVSRHEKGQQLTIDILEDYANALGCSIHDFLPPDQLKRIDEEYRMRVNEIMNLIPEAANLPKDEREKVFSIVENTLKLALRK